MVRPSPSTAGRMGWAPAPYAIHPSPTYLVGAQSLTGRRTAPTAPFRALVLFFVQLPSSCDVCMCQRAPLTENISRLVVVDRELCRHNSFKCVRVRLPIIILECSLDWIAKGPIDFIPPLEKREREKYWRQLEQMTSRVGREKLSGVAGLVVAVVVVPGHWI